MASGDIIIAEIGGSGRHKTEVLVANKVPYDNATSGLAATNVQAAVDELDAAIEAAAGGADVTAIHDNEAGEINAITAKATPVGADVMLIEDSAATFAKKKATLTALAATVATINGEVIDGEVQNHAALPVVVGTPAVGSNYLVQESSGIWWINRKPAGIWRRTANDGDLDDWVHVGEFIEVTKDSNFELRDDADATKILKFQLSGITTETTRTLTVPDASGTVALAGAAPTAHAASHTNGGDDIQSATAAQKGVATAAQITVLEDLDTRDDYHKNHASAGRLFGGVITDATGGKVDISAGAGLTKATSAALGDTPATLNGGQGSDIQLVSWVALEDFALAGVGYNLIYWDASAGAFAVQLRENFYANFDFTRDFTIGRVYYDGSAVTIRLCGMNRWNFARRVQMFGEEYFPVVRATGLMISAVGTRGFALTAGVIWAELVNRFEIPAFSTASESFTYWHRDGGAGWTATATQTQISNTLFDDGDGTLGTVANNRYGVHWVYEVHDGSTHVVYGQASYTLANANLASPPTVLPGIVGAYATLVGKIIILSDAAAFTSILSPFTTQFTAGVPSNHNDLSGIQGGAAADYYHLTAAQTTAATAAQAQATASIRAIGTGTPAALGTAAAGDATTAAASNHIHALPKLDDLATPDDNTDLNATTTAHGLLLKATAPAAGLLNVVGIANGETAYTNKALYDATAPADLGVAAAGSSLSAARRDHVHKIPTLTDLSLNNVTNDAQTKAAIVPNTAPAAGEVLVGNAGGTAYAKVAVSGDATLASTGALTVANDAITLAKMAHGTDGNLITYDADGAPAAVATGTANQVLTSNGAGAAPTFKDAAAGGGDVATDTLWDTKGDLAVGTGANTAAKLAAGTNGYVLTADSGETTGLKWAAASGGGFQLAEATWDGQGQVVLAGVKKYFPVEVAGNVTAAALVADVSGSITITVKRYTPNAGSLGNATTLGTIALSSAVHARDTTLTGWTTSVSVGDVLEMSTTATIATVTRVTATLKLS